MLFVTLIQNSYISSITLPDKKEGRYFLNYYTKNNVRQTVNIDGVGNEWVISRDAFIRIKNDTIEENKHILKERDLFILESDEEEYIIFVEPVEKEKSMFKKLFLKNEEAYITIGQKPGNTICIDSKYISGSHAEITRNGGKWYVKDLDSRNGTYLNNKRITSSELVPGDMLLFLGYKIIIGCNFIAGNFCGDNVTFDKNVFYEKKFEITDDKDQFDNTKIERKYFYRTVRLNTSNFGGKVLTLEAPPQKDKKDENPAIMRLGPSFTMCMGSVLVAGYSVLANYYRGRNLADSVPSVIMAGTMMTSALLWPVILNKYTGKRYKKKENERCEQYTGYISEARSEIKRLINCEYDIMNERYLPADKCAELAFGNSGEPDRLLWSKNINDDDFLNIMIGKGDIQSSLELKYPEKKLSITADSLSDNLYQLVSEDRTVKNVNIPLPLKEGCLCGCTGDRNAALEFVKALSVQLAAQYSYDELKLVYIYNEKEADKWRFSHWLPHVWNDTNTFRYIASDRLDIKELSIQMEKETAARTESDADLSASPYFLIIAADREMAEQIVVLPSILKNYKSIRFSIITLFDMRNYLNSDVMFEFESMDKACMYRRIVKTRKQNDEGTEVIEKRSTEQIFVPDRVNSSVFDRFLRSIANIKLDSVSERYKLPKMLTFLEMFGISKVEHLNCLKRWNENDPSKSLQAPIGVNTSGEKFYLDLHEKYHGPHGLIAGTTGSGKSESIITFILSMAVNYSPEEVAFLIIDYKGGGLADAFESIERTVEDGKEVEKTIKLPHLAGTVTNLDGATVERSRIAIESELKRRQNMFKTARKLSGEGTMDIYKYQQLRRHGMALEPLPHLFIVCDEFAELKSQQPEFMASLVSTARIGRSLGVHLILATQKPDGVVSQEIWSNSRFKICLKVQDKADSSAVIHCPDAAAIQTTGRFYLQVGYNELFSLGQSAWCGADYTGEDRRIVKEEKTAELISSTGSVISEKKIKEKSKVMKRHTVSELVAIRQYIIGLAASMRARPLWLLPLPPFISVNTLYDEYTRRQDKYEIEPLIGKWDDIFEIRQVLMTIPFSKNGNLCVYGVSGSGMDMFFTTLIYSLVKTYSPMELNIHILDFDSGFFRVYENAPQVKNVILSDETDRVSDFLTRMKDEITLRHKLFAPFGGEYRDFCRHSGKELPSVVIVLNNYSMFAEAYENRMSDLVYISREGVKCGIYLALGSATVNVTSRLKQNIGQNIMLKMNDNLEYSSVLGRTEGIIPAAYRGRGLVKYGTHVYEFQTADILSYFPNPDDEDGAVQEVQDPAEVISALCSEACEKYADFSDNNSFEDIQFDVPDIISSDSTPKLTKADLQMCWGDVSNVPLGVKKGGKEILFEDFTNKYMTFVSSDSVEKLSEFCEYIAGVLSQDENADVVLIDPLALVTVKKGSKYQYFEGMDLDDWQETFLNLYLERDAALEQDKSGKWFLPDGFRHVYIVINGFEAAGRASMMCMVRFVEAMLGCDIHNIHYVVADTPEKMNDPCGCYQRIIVVGSRDKEHLYTDNQHDEWFNELGIWLGTGFSKQSLFITENSYDAENEENTAVIIKNGKVTANILNAAGDQNE